MAQHVTKVAPALRGLDHLLVSKRHLRAARRWPWAWWCTCRDGHGAAKTETEAEQQAAAHRAAAGARQDEAQR
ncbi:hypothetical protein OIE75_29470 [Streptomyces sp. NBC_01723]|uniref:hypothetical protein n=1 Tax=Streptomyces sp. NBC_01723 TaxID=2975921 RepID=UPI002E32497C|nr:hypothetical protein [Streptomyces sp. NBC_01723]